MKRKTFLGSKYQNKNGREYEVLQYLEFNDIDKKYYKNTNINYMLTLFQVPYEESYVVASFVGEHEWGSGAYFTDLTSAIEFYNARVKEYVGN